MKLWKTQIHFSTLVVLTAAFTVINILFCVSINLKSILTKWGQDIQVQVYLEEDLDSSHLAGVQKKITDIFATGKIKYVNKDESRAKFLAEMPGFAKDVVGDPEFANSFPASFQVGGLAQNQMQDLESLTQNILKVAGVEDVSYGQEWVQNYAHILRGISGSGGFIILTLVLCSILVVGNSIRMLMSKRREEIEILELVGATSKMIRRPFVIEGGLLGLTSSVAALGLSYIIYQLGLKLLGSSLVLLGGTGFFRFFGVSTCLIFIFLETICGAVSALVCVRDFNTGWAAAESIK